MQGDFHSQERHRDEYLRRRAVARLRNKRDFVVHLVIYLAVNGFLVLVWAITGTPFFWPIFPVVFWGVGIGAHAWDVVGDHEFGEKRIRREIDRMRE